MAPTQSPIEDGPSELTPRSSFAHRAPGLRPEVADLGHYCLYLNKNVLRYVILKDESTLIKTYNHFFNNKLVKSFLRLITSQKLSI